jgi:hypothetical protein
MQHGEIPAAFFEFPLSQLVSPFEFDGELLDHIKERVAGVDCEKGPVVFKDYAVKPLLVNASALARRERLLNFTFCSDKADIQPVGREPAAAADVIHHFFEEGLDYIEQNGPGILKPYSHRDDTIDVWGCPDGFWRRRPADGGGDSETRTYVLELKTFHGIRKNRFLRKIKDDLRQMAAYQLCRPEYNDFVMVYINTNPGPLTSTYTYFALRVAPDENLRFAYATWRQWFIGFGTAGWRGHLAQILRAYYESEHLTPAQIRRDYSNRHVVPEVKPTPEEEKEGATHTPQVTTEAERISTVRVLGGRFALLCYATESSDSD